MLLRYVLDENLRGPLWNLMIRHNSKGVDPIDVVRVGDSDAVPLGTKDPELLRWADVEETVRSADPTKRVGAPVVSNRHGTARIERAPVE